MKRMCLAALTGVLAISATAMAIDVASAAGRGGGVRGGAGRVGVGGVGVSRVGVGRTGVGYRRGALAYRGDYYRGGAGLAAGAALGAAAAAYGSDGYYGSGGYYGGGYYGDPYYGGGYGAYASGAAYDTSPGGIYILGGTEMSEADAIAYCAARFRSYDVQSQTFMSYSGERMSCPVQ